MKATLVALAMLFTAAPVYAQTEIRESPDPINTLPTTPGEPFLQVEPRRADAGQTIEVTGYGCAPEATVSFVLRAPDPISDDEIQAGPEGEFGADLRIPGDANPGRAWLRASCRQVDRTTLSLEETLVIARPSFYLSWVNIIFGGGVGLVVAGLGILLFRKPPRRRRRRRRAIL